MTSTENVSPQWIEAQYQSYQQNPQSVPEEWRSFFQGFELGLDRSTSAPDHKPAEVQTLIRRYREIGHLYACVDPLTPCEFDHPQLQLDKFGLDQADLERTFATDNFILPNAPLKEIVSVLEETYCRSIGIEFTHIPIMEERKWLQERMESTRNKLDLSREKKLATLKKLLQATRFESFIHRKFVGQKRFSLEGGESVIPLLDHLIEHGAGLEIEHVIIGMAHRGRLNVLANIYDKPLENIFAEFADNETFKIVGEGDVKYHKGYSTDRKYGDRNIHISLASNPSHLEAVDPVVEGKCRARQERLKGDGEQLVLPLLIHGDAAFAGQGVVAEVLNLSQLEGYKTGGTIHLVINNQIGFTTLPVDARSTCYPTDIAKMLMSPILHVHGDEPEALLQAATIALEFRQKFRKDVVIEVICYRKHGHNEGDEPFFTQPKMYEAIRSKQPTAEIYRTQLLQEGFAETELDALATDVENELENALQRPPHELEEGFMKKWAKISRDFSFDPVDTSVERQELNRLIAAATATPDDFTPHRKIASLLKKRKSSVESGEKIDWGTGEALAFASIVAEGKSIRVSGQDSRRGTFNHRHATLSDIETGRNHTPLDIFAHNSGGHFTIYNSMLSEMAVLGFDYGYSVETPNDLTIWEAQFGDFANGAQVIIDQFIASSMAKWDRSSGLTMFLPHGYEGQGPEHSSARIERYLQLCAGSNLLVSNPSTPAQLFHLLRRQVNASYRRPLIVFTPKALLRHPACTSSAEDFTAAGFQEIIPDQLENKDCRRVLLCSGKIYYDLLEHRQQNSCEDIAIIRVEQLYPLHRDLLLQILEGYPQQTEYCWVQEETGNGGAWDHLRPQLGKLLGSEITYIGRKRSASPAVGSHRVHKLEQQRIIEQAFAE
ncbi:2-oxoglutarate dehydrogenase E1 component [Malonomonas rubra DSM 5091]|uniref:oxoglutarate dehydrogenase (succinyl-transferring) n=1 Tax=Malonomonas rubra DSM 5091 TaxID=1122189 RepID=A0A1M6F719_MALRU|nr:2-oxoglutarate dehydrogenase E1 component [Malonomonas rubra]SHI93497.1 2-oxoglutarate dehydrogenase E1 component [Malonomonas rubra DSM 5091]